MGKFIHWSRNLHLADLTSKNRSVSSNYPSFGLCSNKEGGANLNEFNYRYPTRVLGFAFEDIKSQLLHILCLPDSSYLSIQSYFIL